MEGAAKNGGMNNAGSTRASTRKCSTPNAKRDSITKSVGDIQSLRRRQSAGSLDWRAERMKETSTLRRLCFDIKFIWNWSPWTTRGVLETWICLYYLFFVPYQIGFETDVAFTNTYIISYTLDSVLVLSLISRKVFPSKPKKKAGGVKSESSDSSNFASDSSVSDFGGSNPPEPGKSPSKSAERVLRNSRKLRKGAAQKKTYDYVILFILAIPFDAIVWAYPNRASIPFVRLTRFAFALVHTHRDLVALEGSQTAPFALARLTRILLFYAIVAHSIACAFMYVTTRPDALHFVTAPWLSSPDPNPGVGTRYIRCVYWSFVTLTTAGHVDIVAARIGDPGEDWEVGMATVICVLSMFVYIYINANFTTMMIRLNSRLEQYRAQLAGIDAYLSRNKVSRDVCKRVKRYFARASNSSASADKALLESLPGSLQREVLQDIHMRTLRSAYIFANIEPAALAQICAVVRTVTFLPEEIICQQNDVMTEMYFLEEGNILASIVSGIEDELNDEDHSNTRGRGKTVGGALFNGRRRPSDLPFAGTGTRTEKMIKIRGTPMCELPFLFSLRQEATLEAVTTSKCCVLQKSDYMALMQEFPDILDRAQTSCLSLMRLNKDPLLPEVERMRIKSEKKIAQFADMLFAAQAGKLEIVQEGIEQGGVDVNEKDFEGRSVIHVAASSDRQKMVQYLIHQKADVNAVDVFGRTPLANAVAKGYSATVDVLMQAGGNLGWDDAEMAGELCLYARENNIKQLKLLLACGAVINAADYDKRTCLHLAASEGNMEVCALLLEHKADANILDRWGGTPLRDAVREGHYDVAALLRQHQGQLHYDEATASGELCELARSGDAEKLQLLLSCGLDINVADYDLRTCLHLASSSGRYEIVKWLLESGAEVNAKDRLGGTPLRDAVREGHLDVAKLLSSYNGVLGHDEAEVSSDLCELAKKGDTEKLETMIMCGVKVGSADYDKRTALHLAASEGWLDVVQLLVKYNADVNAKDRWGGTPLRDAVREGRAEVATFLQEHGADLGMDELMLGTTMCELARAGKRTSLQVLSRLGSTLAVSDHEGRTPLHVAAAEGHEDVVRSLLALGWDPDAEDRCGNTPRSDAEKAGHGWVDVFELPSPLIK